MLQYYRYFQLSQSLLLFHLVHNSIGYLFGYFAGKLTKLPEQDCRTNAIEVGIQNSGLGVTLAVTHLSPLAALPSAFASAWQVVTGTFFAQFWSTRAPYDEEVTRDEKTEKSLSI
ncbi:hypothetical protein LIT25_27295 (plasmid) [Bacillus sp. F19]|nr:hypothetical protein LIT25_27295 [Bacillus sp. F19]